MAMKWQLMFEAIPDKIPVSGKRHTDVWPEHGDKCEMNLFYRSFEKAGGWVGDSFLRIWSPEEVREYAANLVEQYPEAYSFFATDGGGNVFGFCQDGQTIIYVSAPNIGDEDDIKVLGNWKEFLERIANSDHV